MKASKTYQVSYTKKVGGNGTIIVKAQDEAQALVNAKFLCATGSDFRSAILTDENYNKPRLQGFAGRQ
jgi:hypothetical protein